MIVKMHSEMRQFLVNHNQNCVKSKLNCVNTISPDIAKRETTAPSHTETNSWKLLQSTRNVCTAKDTASSVLPADSYTKMKSRICKRLLNQCRKCNHNAHLFQQYTTTWCHHHSIVPPMTTPRVLRTSTWTLNQMWASHQKIKKVLTPASEIS